ncbi:MAG TPA: hypothetical protein VGZ22_17865 [Isosphaeraceae bacterium]|jgi:hypothetical protein|nr:hypothetical protein [Isosphaeraceae bacterium]
MGLEKKWLARFIAPGRNIVRRWSNYEFRDGDQTIQSPEDLERYDPKLYELLSRVYPDHHIPMDVYHAKNLKPGRRRGP